MKKRFFTLALAPLLTVALVGCDVDVEDGGSLPTVDVQGGEMPDIDVAGPSVDTGTATVEVPTVDIDAADEGDAEATDDD